MGAASYRMSRGAMTNEERLKARMKRQQNTKSDIDGLVDDQIFAMLKEDPTLLRKLPPGAKASLIAQRLPKAQPIDQDFQKQALSLEELVADLPDTAKQQRALAALRVANQKLRAKYREEKARNRRLNRQLEKLKGRDKGLKAFLIQSKIMRREWIKFGAQRQVCLDQYGMTVEELEALAESAFEGESFDLSGEAEAEATEEKEAAEAAAKLEALEEEAATLFEEE